MKKIYLILLMCVAYLGANAQIIESEELVQYYTIADIQQVYDDSGLGETLQNVAPITYEVAAYKVIYNTVDADGTTPVLASGAMYIPIKEGENCASPMVAYLHGTMSKRQDAPSQFNGGAESLVGLAGATSGYVGMAPDYLGLGEGTSSFHYYIHAHSEATASTDMVLAVKEHCANNDIPLNDQLFLMGYSQGGHAAMATHRYIQENYDPSELQVTGSVPMAGPYDLSGAQTDMLLSGQAYANPAYLPFIFFSFDHVYDLYDDLSEILIEPYDVELPPLFDMETGLGAADAILPPTVLDIVQPDYLEAFINDENHPFRQALADNDLLDWVPETPMHLFHCVADEQVAYQNSVVAHDYFSNLPNSAEVTFEEPPFSTFLDHPACGGVSIPLAKQWIDQLSELCSEPVEGGVDIKNFNHRPVIVYPNPVQSHINITMDYVDNFDIRIFDMDGREAINMMGVSGSNFSIPRGDLHSGMYVLEMTIGEEVIREKVMLK